MIVALCAVVAAAHVVVFDGGGGAAAVESAVAAVAAAGDTGSVLDAADVDALEGCVSDACALEVAAAHGAEFVVVVRADGVVRFDVGAGDVVTPTPTPDPAASTTEPPESPAPAALPPGPPAPKGPPAATRPPRDERPLSSTGFVVEVVGGVTAAVGVATMALGAVSLVQPGASEQHTTGLALVGGGGLIAVAGAVAYGVGETLRE